MFSGEDITENLMAIRIVDPVETSEVIRGFGPIILIAFFIRALNRVAPGRYLFCNERYIIRIERY